MRQYIRVVFFLAVAYLTFPSTLQGMKRVYPCSLETDKQGRGAEPTRAIILRQEQDSIVFSRVEGSKELGVVKELERVPQASWESVLFLMHLRDKELPTEIKAYIAYLLLGTSLEHNVECASITETSDLGIDKKLILNPDKRTFITTDLEECDFRLWSSKTGKQLVPSVEKIYGCVACSPTGQIVVFQEEDEETISLYRIATDEQSLEPVLEPKIVGGIRVVAFSPDGLLVSTLAYGEVVCVHDTTKGECLLKMSAQTAQLSPDGKTILIGLSNATLQLWNLVEKRLLHTMQENTGSPVSSIRFNPTGKTVLTESRYGNICLWDIKTGHLLQAFKAPPFLDHSAAVFSPDGTSLLISFIPSQTVEQNRIHMNGGPTICFSTKISVCNAETGEFLHALDGFSHEGFSSDGTIALTKEAEPSVIRDDFGRILQKIYSNISLSFWNSKTGQLLSSFPAFFPPDEPIQYVKISPNNASIVVVTKNERTTTKLYLINRITQKLVLELILHEYFAEPLFSPDSTKLLTCSGTENKAGLWSTKTGNHLHTLGENDHTDNKNVRCIGFNHDGTMIITGSADGKVGLWTFLCKTYEWTKGCELGIFHAWLIHKMVESKEVSLVPFTMAEDSFEYKLFESMPDYVKEYLIKWYKPFIKSQEWQLIPLESKKIQHASTRL